MLVMKFGGTSVENVTAIQRLARILNHFRDQQLVIVVSAMGKTTNGLLECGRLAATGDVIQASERLTPIADLHLATVRELAQTDEVEQLESEITQRFASIDLLLTRIAAAGDLNPALSDELLANGELLSSTVVAAALRSGGLPAHFVDIRAAMIPTDDFTRASVIF